MKDFSFTTHINSDIIMSLPGIKDVFTAIDIISEIGVDMSVFHAFELHISYACKKRKI